MSTQPNNVPAPELPSSKLCSKCGEDKPLSSYGPHARGKYKLQAACRACQTAANSARYWADPEKGRERSRLRSLESQKRDPEKRNAQRRAWVERNREKDRESKRKWREGNPEANRQSARAWANANRTYRRAAVAKRREDSFTASDVAELLKQQKNRCAICRVRLSVYHVDHITPIARGGSNARSNIQILCPSCNRSKGAKDPVEFMQSLGRLI